MMGICGSHFVVAHCPLVRYLAATHSFLSACVARGNKCKRSCAILVQVADTLSAILSNNSAVLEAIDDELVSELLHVAAHPSTKHAKYIRLLAHLCHIHHIGLTKYQDLVFDFLFPEEVLQGLPQRVFGGGLCCCMASRWSQRLGALGRPICHVQSKFYHSETNCISAQRINKNILMPIRLHEDATTVELMLPKGFTFDARVPPSTADLRSCRTQKKPEFKSERRKAVIALPTDEEDEEEEDMLYPSYKTHGHHLMQVWAALKVKDTMNKVCVLTVRADVRGIGKNTERGGGFGAR